jgi:hypothetical protein
MRRNDASRPSGVAVVNHTRRCATIGEDHPRPGTAVFQAMFCVSLHSTGRPRAAESPCPVGPRNCGQSWAYAISCSRSATVKTRDARTARVRTRTFSHRLCVKRLDDLPRPLPGDNAFRNGSHFPQVEIREDTSAAPEPDEASAWRTTIALDPGRGSSEFVRGKHRGDVLAACFTPRQPPSRQAEGCAILRDCQAVGISIPQVVRDVCEACRRVGPDLGRLAIGVAPDVPSRHHAEPDSAPAGVEILPQQRPVRIARHVVRQIVEGEDDNARTLVGDALAEIRGERESRECLVTGSSEVLRNPLADVGPKGAAAASESTAPESSVSA